VIGADSLSLQTAVHAAAVAEVLKMDGVSPHHNTEVVLSLASDLHAEIHGEDLAIQRNK